MKRRDPGTLEGAITLAYEQAGGVKQVSFMVGRTDSLLYAYADPQNRKAMPLDVAARIVAMGGVALAEYFAGLAGGTFRPGDAAASDARLIVLATAAVREGAEAVAAVIEGSADAPRETEEAVRAFASLSAAARARSGGGAA